MGSRKGVQLIIEQLKKRQLVAENAIQKLCEQAKEIIRSEPNLVNVSSPVTICGDIHGQFDDLLELFKIGGFPPYANYIFMGDYVDRGRDSIETFLLLLALKVRHRNRVTLLRGNHESRLITQVYGFYDECIRKYGSLNVWRAFTDVFDCLTLTATVDNKIFCVHGGLSPHLKSISDIGVIDRLREIPPDGTMCDLLWSDPDQIEGWSASGRGAGYIFGRDTVEQFCHANGFTLIARAHQLVMEGYKYMFNDKLVTVWSAPNYYYRCGNVASIIELDENIQKYFKIFEAAPADDKASDGKSVPHYFL